MDYRREIDGLRALAVLPVILFHAGFSMFSGGFVGVDVFFVISGYLITTIILAELARGDFSIAKFYERRARRILPALFTVILVCLPFAWTTLDPFEMKEFSQSIFATSLFSSNFYFFLKTGYFDISAELKPLLHTWSLGVEEHYYILFPLAIMPLWRHGRKLILPVFAAIFVASLVFAQWGVQHHPSMAFYLLPARAWEILLGTLCAILLMRHEQRMLAAPMWIKQLGSLAGVALVVFAIFAFDAKTLAPGAAMLVPTVGTALIILFARPGTLAHGLLGLRLFVMIGVVSYSAYLWHQPALAFFRLYFVEDPSQGVAIALLVTVFVLSYLTYRFVEQPFRAHGSLKLSRRQVFGFSLAGLVLLAAVGFAGHHTLGFPSRNEQALRLGQNFGLSEACSGAALDDPRCMSKPDAKVILWGDSFAMHVAQALAKVYPDQGLWQMTLSACPPVPGFMNAPIKAAVTCDVFNDRVIKKLRSLPHPEQYTLVLSTVSFLPSEQYQPMAANTYDELRKLGYKMVLISPTPHYPGTRKCLKVHSRTDNDFSTCTFDFTEADNSTFFERLRSYAGLHDIQFVDLSKMFCEDGTHCSIQKNGVLLMRDPGHMSTESPETVAAFLRTQLRPGGPDAAAPAVSAAASAPAAQAR